MRIVNSASGAYFRFTDPPPTMIVSGGNAGAVRVVIFDATGQQDKTTAAAFTLTVTGPSYSQTYTSNAAGSFAIFNTSADALTTAGVYTYTVSASGYTSVTANATVGSTVLGSLTIGGVPQSATAGTMYTVTVTAKDNTGATMTSFTGSVALASSDAAATFAPQNYTFNTSDAGVHTFKVTLNTAGTQSISVTALGTTPGVPIGASEAGITVSVPLHAVMPSSVPRKGLSPVAAHVLPLPVVAGAIAEPGAAVLLQSGPESSNAAKSSGPESCAPLTRDETCE